MKKVLFFVESLAGGGAEKVLADIVKNLDHNKYDVTVCTVSDGGIYQAEVEKYCDYKALLKDINKEIDEYYDLVEVYRDLNKRDQEIIWATIDKMSRTK